MLPRHKTPDIITLKFFKGKLGNFLQEDFTKSIMWISDQLHYDEKYFCREYPSIFNIYIYFQSTYFSISTISTTPIRYFYRECCRSKEGLWYIWVYLLQVFFRLMLNAGCWCWCWCWIWCCWWSRNNMDELSHSFFILLMLMLFMDCGSLD